MSSEASPAGAWPPYDSYRDCSRGICSIYCPQWCYIIFPPPPPSDSDSGSGAAFSPLIIAIIGILASAFLLVSYYTIVTRYCRGRRGSTNSEIDFDARRDEAHPDQWGVAAAGLDDSLIKSITVFKYLRSDKLVEGTECAVCLNEFKEEEDLRLLPKCCHAFHIPCIDTWLKSQSNCPLCRATVNPYAPVSPHPGQGRAPNPQTSSAAVSVSALEIQRGNDLVFVVEEPGRNDSVSVGVGHVCDEQKENCGERNSGNRGSDDQEPGTRLGRSVSLGGFSGHRNLLVSQEPGIEIGSSRGIHEGDDDLVAMAMMRRCSSTGRFEFNKGDKMHILPPS